MTEKEKAQKTRYFASEEFRGLPMEDRKRLWCDYAVRVAHEDRRITIHKADIDG